MKSVTVLIVEDDPIVSEDIERTLLDLGFKVVGCAITGKDAIRLAKETQPDVVLMDITLRGNIDGIEAATIIKVETDAVVIYLTAHSDTHTFERAKITEPCGYIIKPFNETDLRITIGLALYKRESKNSLKVKSLPVSNLLSDGKPLEDSASDLALKPQFLRELDLFSLLTEAERAKFATHCRSVKFNAGEIIVNEGGDQGSCYIVMSGRVSMFKSSPNGRELVVEILAPKDLANLMAAFDEQAAAVTLKAVAKSVVLVIPKRILYELLNSHPEFYQVFIQRASYRLRVAYDTMRAMAHDKVEARIASMLAELSKRDSLCTGLNGGIQITRQELADLTGTTPETAIRVTRSLEEKGILELSKRGTIAIRDMEELKDFAESL